VLVSLQVPVSRAEAPGLAGNGRAGSLTGAFAAGTVTRSRHKVDAKIASIISKPVGPAGRPLLRTG
jgi:hypothetical protein